MGRILQLRRMGWGVGKSGGAATPFYLLGGAPTPIQANNFIGVASYAAAKTNLITPGTLDLVDGTAFPSWDSSTGALFNTTTEYLKTGLTTANGNVSAMCVFTVNSNTVGPTFTVFGSYGSGKFLVQRKDSNDLVFFNSSNIVVTGGALTTGKHSVAIAGGNAYLDGALVSGTMNKAAIELEIYLGALHYGAGAIQSCGSYISHWVFWNTILTGPQVAAISGGV